VLRCIIISPDRELASHLEAAVSALGEVTVCRTLDAYPGEVDLMRTLRAHGPQVVFLSFEFVEKALDLVRLLENHGTGVQVIAMHREMDPTLLRDSMRAGVREFIASPFERRLLIESLCGVKDLLERSPVSGAASSEIFSFLPSKAGVGTTTIGLNISAALARLPNKQVLLSDFDLSSGMLRFLLKLQTDYSVIDAVEHASHVDEGFWPQLVTSVGRLQVMHAGRLNPNLRIDPAQIRNLVEHMRRNYDVLCFDLSGNLERYSLELMQESKRILLVCTPEIASLHLAREKIAYLRSLDLDQRISIVLNRVSKKPLFTREQVEELLGMPVVRSFANDYLAVNRAMTAGKTLDPSTELGKQFTDFAQHLLEPLKPKTVSPKKGKFLEFFTVSNTSPVQSTK
jgi:pilus assembly protein CpaE